MRAEVGRTRIGVLFVLVVLVVLVVLAVITRGLSATTPTQSAGPLTVATTPAETAETAAVSGPAVSAPILTLALAVGGLAGWSVWRTRAHGNTRAHGGEINDNDYEVQFTGTKSSDNKAKNDVMAKFTINNLGTPSAGDQLYTYTKDYVAFYRAKLHNADIPKMTFLLSVCSILDIPPVPTDDVWQQFKQEVNTFLVNSKSDTQTTVCMLRVARLVIQTYANTQSLNAVLPGYETPTHVYDTYDRDNFGSNPIPTYTVSTVDYFYSWTNNATANFNKCCKFANTEDTKKVLILCHTIKKCVDLRVAMPTAP